MKNNSDINEFQSKLKYYDNYFRKEYNLHRATLVGYSFTKKVIQYNYQDNEATINLKLKV